MIVLLFLLKSNNEKYHTIYFILNCSFVNSTKTRLQLVIWLRLTEKYPISDHFLLSGDLMYIGKGTNGVFLTKEYTSYHLHYLEASPSPTVKLHRHFNIDVGFYYSQLLRANVKWFSGYSVNVTDEFERQDYGSHLVYQPNTKGFSWDCVINTV